jgi:hypothetical protein
MPFISSRRLHRMQARIDSLIVRAENAEHEAVVQANATSLIAQRQVASEGTIAGARAALAAPYLEVRARCERLEQANASLTRNNLALHDRLWDALGYTPEQRAAIESGKGEPVKASA